MSNPLTVAQAAKLRGVSHQAVLKWINNYGLPATKFGRDWQIDPANLEKFTPRKRGPKKGEKK